MRARYPRVAPHATWGGILIFLCVVLIVLWNVVIVNDYLRLGAVQWWIFAIGLVLFAALLAGLITFLVNLLKQIRTNQAQSNFIDAVTHELKTPLTSLKLHLQSLEMGRVPPDRQQEFHRILLDDVERLNQLVDHVLDAGRLEQRPKDLQKQVVPLKPAIAEAVETARQRYRLKAEMFSVNGPDATVLTDPHALQLVLVNLLDNAIKYSGNDPRVAIHVSTGDRDTLIAIRDNGIGIPPKQQKRIFSRFYRLGNEMTRRQAGTGLGLFIVRETLRRLGGRIEVASQGEGQGSTFTIRLPGGEA